MLLNADQVAAYLREHPEFFDQNGALLADVNVPHPHGGRAISISERQILTLREKNKLLESKLADLIRYGEENDAIGKKLHALALALIGARACEAALDAVHTSLREDFAVPHSALRLWGIPAPQTTLSEFSAAAPELRRFAEAMTAPYCGQHPGHDTRDWFGEAGVRLRSFALIPLRGAETIGLLALASEDARRFYPEMGTLYLKWLGDLVGAALLACVQVR